MPKLNEKQNSFIICALMAIIIVTFGIMLWALDWDILYFIQNNLRNSLFDTIVPLYTTLGEVAIMWIVWGLVMLIFKKYRRCGFMVLLALIAGLLICNIALKNLVARTRPCYIDETIALLVGNPSEYSFPSGHSVSSMAAALTIFLHHKKMGIVAIILAILMGISRLYVFVHFPTDVYGGFIIGAFIALGLYLAEKKFLEKR